MTLSKLQELATKASVAKSIPNATKKRLARELPTFIRSINSDSIPKTVLLPSGVKARNATIDGCAAKDPFTSLIERT
jgi:hypothetical protein